MESWNEWIKAWAENNHYASPSPSFARDKKNEILHKLNRLFPGKFCCTVWNSQYSKEIKEQLLKEENQSIFYSRYIAELYDFRQLSVEDVEKQLLKYIEKIEGEISLEEENDCEEKEIIGYSFQTMEVWWKKTDEWKYVEITRDEEYSEERSSYEKLQHEIFEDLQRKYRNKLYELLKEINLLRKKKLNTDPKAVICLQKKENKVEEKARYLLKSYIKMKAFEVGENIFEEYTYPTFPDIVYPKVEELYTMLLDRDIWGAIKKSLQNKMIEDDSLICNLLGVLINISEEGLLPIGMADIAEFIYKFFLPYQKDYLLLTKQISTCLDFYELDNADDVFELYSLQKKFKEICKRMESLLETLGSKIDDIEDDEFERRNREILEETLRK